MTFGKIENWLDIRELVLMSIGTDKGRWWADKNFGSELWKLRLAGKITPDTAENMRQMILDSVQWIVDDGLASRIECAVEQQGRDRIAYCVTVVRPDGSAMRMKEVWNGV